MAPVASSTKSPTTPEYFSFKIDTPIFDNKDYRHVQTVKTQSLPNNGLAITYLGEDRKSRLILCTEADIQNIMKQSNFSPKTSLVIDSAIIYSFVIHDRYFVYLYSPIKEKAQNKLGYIMEPSLFIRKMTLDGKQIFDKPLVNDANMDELWNRQYYRSNSSNTGSDGTQIVWTGKYYSVLFPHFTHCQDKVNHQMDSWYLIDTIGTIKNLADMQGYANGWSWLSSHSFGQRLVYSPFESGNLLAVSANDAYPVRAINLHSLNMEKIAKEVNTSVGEKILSVFTGTQDQPPLVKIITPFDGLGEQIGKLVKEIRLDKFFQDLGTAFAKPTQDIDIFASNSTTLNPTPSTEANIIVPQKNPKAKIGVSKTAKKQEMKQVLIKKDSVKSKENSTPSTEKNNEPISQQKDVQIDQMQNKKRTDSLAWEYIFNHGGKHLLSGNSLFQISGNTGNNYIANTQLGGIIPIKSGALFAFCSAEKSTDKLNSFMQDVGFIKLNTKNRVEIFKWLTFTPKLGEQNVQISKIGNQDSFIITWDVFTDTTDNTIGPRSWEREQSLKFSHSEFVIIDEEGNIIRSEATFDQDYSVESVPITHRRTRSYNIAQLTNGDVTILKVCKNPNQLDMLIFRLKQPSKMPIVKKQ